MIWKFPAKKLFRYRASPNFISSVRHQSHHFSASLFFSKTLNIDFHGTPITPLVFDQTPPNPTLFSGFSSLQSEIHGTSIATLVSRSLVSLTRCGVGLLVPHGHFRLLSSSAKVKNGNFEEVSTSGPGKTQYRGYTPGGFTSDVCPKNISKIVEIIRSGESGLDEKFNLIGVNVSVKSLCAIFDALNRQRLPALRFFVWAREKNPSLYKNADVCSLIIDNCGWLNDYETMRSLLKDLSLNGICLTDKAFTFLHVPGSSKNLLLNSIKGVVELLNEVGGSCRGSGIHGLIKMFAELGLFEIAKFVMEITEKKVQYYNVLVLEKCKRCYFQEAFGLIAEMWQSGCIPDARTYSYVLSSLCKYGRTSEAWSLLEEMKEKGCLPDALTYEVFICSSIKLGKMDAAEKVLDDMVSRGVRPRLETHAAFVKGYFDSRQYEKAYKYVVDSSNKYKESSNKVYSLLASLHREKGNLTAAESILKEMMNKGLTPLFPDYVKTSKRLFRTGRKQSAKELKNRFHNTRQSRP